MELPSYIYLTFFDVFKNKLFNNELHEAAISEKRLINIWGYKIKNEKGLPSKESFIRNRFHVKPLYFYEQWLKAKKQEEIPFVNIAFIRAFEYLEGEIPFIGTPKGYEDHAEKCKNMFVEKYMSDLNIAGGYNSIEEFKGGHIQLNKFFNAVNSERYLDALFFLNNTKRWKSEPLRFKCCLASTLKIHYSNIKKDTDISPLTFNPTYIIDYIETKIVYDLPQVLEGCKHKRSEIESDNFWKYIFSYNEMEKSSSMIVFELNDVLQEQFSKHFERNVQPKSIFDLDRSILENEVFQRIILDNTDYFFEAKKKLPILKTYDQNRKVRVTFLIEDDRYFIDGFQWFEPVQLDGVFKSKNYLYLKNALTKIES